MITAIDTQDTNRPIVGNTIPCLEAFYGARAKRNNTVKAHTGAGHRPQEIYTPPAIIDALLRVWPHIALDPCAGPQSLVGALDTYYIPGRPNAKGKLVYAAQGDEQDGLVEPWVDYTYANPPFCNLKPWLEKARFEGSRAGRGNGLEVAMLCPTRGHRTWTRDAWTTCTSVIDLNPLKFVGFTSTFPEPLVVLYWGDSKALFELSFEGLGDAR